jgi:hypothetical protein
LPVSVNVWHPESVATRTTGIGGFYLSDLLGNSALARSPPSSPAC